MNMNRTPGDRLRPTRSSPVMGVGTIPCQRSQRLPRFTEFSFLPQMGYSLKGLFDTDEPSLQPSGHYPNRRDEPAGFPQALRRGSTARHASRLSRWAVKAELHQTTDSYQETVSNRQRLV